MKAKAVLLAVLAFCAAGCGTLKPITAPTVGGGSSLLSRLAAGLLTRAQVDDFVWEGAAGPSTPIEQEIADASGNSDLTAAISAVIATHLIEPTGARVLRITLVGEAKPRIFFCRRDLAVACQPQVNAGVRVYAAPASLGNLGFLVVHRISIQSGS